MYIPLVDMEGKGKKGAGERRDLDMFSRRWTFWIKMVLENCQNLSFYPLYFMQQNGIICKTSRRGEQVSVR